MRDAVDEDEDDESRFAVWPDNVPVVELFTVHCRTQWVPSFGGVVGFNYPAVDIVLRRRRVKKQDQVFADLQIMERAALPILNEPSDD